MNFPKLQIQTTSTQLGYHVQKGIQEIEQPRASLEIQQPTADLKIETTNPKLNIDTQQARNDLDLKSVRKRIEEFASDGMQGAQEGKARRARQGDDLMQIENKSNPIKSQAKQNTSNTYSELSIKFVPSYGSVKVSIEPGRVDIHSESNNVIINSTENKPIYNYTPAKLKTEILQHGTIQIDWLL